MGKEFQSCGASIIIYSGNKVLLQKRRDNGCWGYHGGHVDMGECVEDCAKRELLEEIGLVAKSIHLLNVFSGDKLFHTYPDGNMVHIIDIVYVCDDFEGEISLQESEVVDIEWFDIDSIPENISPPIKPGIEYFKEWHQNRFA